MDNFQTYKHRKTGEIAEAIEWEKGEFLVTLTSLTNCLDGSFFMGSKQFIREFELINEDQK